MSFRNANFPISTLGLKLTYLSLNLTFCKPWDKIYHGSRGGTNSAENTLTLGKAEWTHRRNANQTPS